MPEIVCNRKGIRVKPGGKDLTGLGMVAHTCNPSIWEAEAGGMRVSGQPGLHSETLSVSKRDRGEKERREMRESVSET
jgi:hypothetical protein